MSTSVTTVQDRTHGHDRSDALPQDLPFYLVCHSCQRKRQYTRTDHDGDHIYYCPTCDWYSVGASVVRTQE